jgi:nitric oxide reductase large subunit
MVDQYYSYLQIGSDLINIGIALAVALVLFAKSAFNMIEKKNIGTFMPFLTLGLALCFSAAFMYYENYSYATDVFLIWKIIAAIGMAFVLWRDT